jgi:hypothetical protein
MAELTDDEEAGRLQMNDEDKALLAQAAALSDVFIAQVREETSIRVVVGGLIFAIRSAIAGLPNENQLLHHVADYFEGITSLTGTYPETPVPEG